MKPTIYSAQATQINRGEKVQFTGRLSLWPILFLPLTPAVLVVAAIIYQRLEIPGVTQVIFWVAGGWSLCVVAQALWLLATFAATVSNRRLYARTGLLVIKESAINLSKVSEVTVQQSLLGRLLGYGNLIVQAGGSSECVLPRIAGPSHFRRELFAAIHINDERREGLTGMINF